MKTCKGGALRCTTTCELRKRTGRPDNMRKRDAYSLCLHIVHDAKMGKKLAASKPHLTSPQRVFPCARRLRDDAY